MASCFDVAILLFVALAFLTYVLVLTTLQFKAQPELLTSTVGPSIMLSLVVIIIFGCCIKLYRDVQRRSGGIWKKVYPVLEVFIAVLIILLPIQLTAYTTENLIKYTNNKITINSPRNINNSGYSVTYQTSNMSRYGHVLVAIPLADDGAFIQTNSFFITVKMSLLTIGMRFIFWVIYFKTGFGDIKEDCHAGIQNAAFALLDGVDAFSLLDDMIDYPEYFNEHYAQTSIGIAAFCITTLCIHWCFIAEVFFYEKGIPEQIVSATKGVYWILLNLLLMIVRIVVSRESQNSNVKVSQLFIAKELLMIFFGTVLFIIIFNESRKARDRRKSRSARNSMQYEATKSINRESQSVISPVSGLIYTQVDHTRNNHKRESIESNHVVNGNELTDNDSSNYVFNDWSLDLQFPEGTPRTSTISNRDVIGESNEQESDTSSLKEEATPMCTGDEAGDVEFIKEDIITPGENKTIKTELPNSDNDSGEYVEIDSDSDNEVTVNN